jgi:D-aminoacyl-tRNA deacylase
MSIIVSMSQFRKGLLLRAVLQRVDKARVTIEGRMVSAIGQGLLVFLGVETGDGFPDAEYLLQKINNLRIFEDSEGKMNLSLLDVAGEMLVVSQFTLLGDCRKGRRPSFTAAEEPQKAKLLYDYFIAQAQGKNWRVAGGEFQAMMKVELINDGPVTMMIDSKKLF